ARRRGRRRGDRSRRRERSPPARRCRIRREPARTSPGTPPPASSSSSLLAARRNVIVHARLSRPLSHPAARLLRLQFTDLTVRLPPCPLSSPLPASHISAHVAVAWRISGRANKYTSEYYASRRARAR